MSCPSCLSTSNTGFCPHFSLGTDGTFLTSRNTNYIFEPVDLEPLVVLAETDTQLQLDIATKALIYTGERASNGIGSPSTVPVKSIANLISLVDIFDVTDSSPTNGDLLTYNSATSQWRAYTIPTGDVVSTVGVDVSGNLVKQDGGAETPEAAIPVGGIIVWPGTSTSIPAGFHVADGSPLSRSVYAGLYSILGTTYGNGNGSTTFNLPNLNGRVPVGQSDSEVEFDNIGETGGEKTHVLSYDEMPLHSHGVNDPGHHHPLWTVGQEGNSYPLSGPSTVVVLRSSLPQANSGNGTTGHVTTGIGIGNAGSSIAHNNLQPYITMLYIIRII